MGPVINIYGRGIQNERGGGVKCVTPTMKKGGCVCVCWGGGVFSHAEGGGGAGGGGGTTVVFLCSFV